MMYQQILILIVKQLCFLFGIQTAIYFYCKDIKQACYIVYTISNIISVIYGFSEFYRIFLTNDDNIWNLNSKERLETETNVAFFLVTWEASYDLFQVIMDGYFQRLELLFSIHHVLAMILYYFTLINPIAQIYCCYYAGVAQISNLFLNLRAREFNLSPKLFYIIDLMFVITFLFNRILIWSLISPLYWKDAIAFLKIEPTVGMGIHFVSQILLTLMQYYWGYTIFKKMFRKINRKWNVKTNDDNIKKSS
jgi:hypothetical protein